MESTRQTGTAMTVERVFAPGRLRRPWMAAAYERLVPIRRICPCQECKVNSNRIQEERLCAL